MNVFVVTETDNKAEHTLVVRVTTTLEGGKRAAELDYHEDTGRDALPWDDTVLGGASFARTGTSTYGVVEMEVME